MSIDDVGILHLTNFNLVSFDEIAIEYHNRNGLGDVSHLSPRSGKKTKNGLLFYSFLMVGIRSMKA